MTTIPKGDEAPVWQFVIDGRDGKKVESPYFATYQNAKGKLHEALGRIFGAAAVPAAASLARNTPEAAWEDTVEVSLPTYKGGKKGLRLTHKRKTFGISLYPVHLDLE